MSLRNTLRKAAGLLVELPPEEETVETATPEDSTHRVQAETEVQKVYSALDAVPFAPPQPQTKTVEQIVREADGPNLDQIHVAEHTLPPVINDDGSVNFGAIYQGANLPTVPFSAEQIQELMASLPAELPLETKRQTVKASIVAMGKSIGATPESIVADASRKLAALAAYTDSLTKQTTEFTMNAELEISQLQAQIEEKRKAITDAQQKQAQVTERCSAESHRLDDVLEFFSLDVAPSKYAPSDPNATR